jgi:hypothetical protein
MDSQNISAVRDEREDSPGFAASTAKKIPTVKFRIKPEASIASASSSANIIVLPPALPASLSGSTRDHSEDYEDDQLMEDVEPGTINISRISPGTFSAGGSEHGSRSTRPG